MQHELTKEQVPKFALAGNARITLQSCKTGKHFTYRIKKYEDGNLYFIHLLRGPNNEEDYTYVGCYYADRRSFKPAKNWQGIPNDRLPASVAAINYLLKNLYNKPDKLSVYHEGRCGRCGRLLTTPENIKAGYGPECQSIMERGE